MVLRIGVLGTGQRGFALSQYFLNNPSMGCIVAAADPDTERLNQFGERHGIPNKFRFLDYRDLILGAECDAVFVTTMDRLHFSAAAMALEHGLHVLLEKPMSPTPEETTQLVRKSEEAGKLLMVCHELRYTPFFESIKSIIDSGKIGQVSNINLAENVEHIHFSHSFVRGNWSNSERASFMLLSKSCHDIDILTWLIEPQCKRVSSFGSLTHFTKDNAPEGSTTRCTDGCLIESSCPYSARKVYVESDRWYRAATFSEDKEKRLQAIQDGPYGRCVWHCDNDVVDHQVVVLEFDGGITATFSMVAFTKEETRTIRVFGTEGEIRGHMLRNEIDVHTWDGGFERITLPDPTGGHSGGDFRLVSDFVRQIEEGRLKGGRTNANVSADSHLVTFAAEHARLTAQVVDVTNYILELNREGYL